MRIGRWIGPCLAFSLLASIARAQEKPVRLDGDPAVLLGTEWYGVYSDNKKVGYFWASWVKEKVGGAEAYVLKEGMAMKIAALGEKTEISSESAKWFDSKAPYAFRGGWSVNKQNDSESRIDVERSGEKLRATIREGGEKREMAVELPDYTLADSLTSILWIRKGPKVGDRLTTRTFDLDELESDLDTLEVLSTKSAIVDGVKLRYFEVRLSSARAGEHGDATVDEKGRLLSAVLGGMFEVRREPEKLARQIEFGADLFVRGMIKVDKALGDPAEVAELVVRVKGDGATHLKDGPGQTVVTGRDGTILSIGAARGGAVRVTPEEEKENLKTTVEFPADHAKIRAILAEAVGDAKTPREKAERLVRFVDKFIEDSYSAQPQTVLDILAARKGDCTEHADLFATLCRAAGIPCRVAGGMIYMGDDAKAFGGHAWNEVALEGVWVPMDATWGEVKINATHVRIGAGGGSVGDFMKVFGKLEFQLVEMKRK